MRTAEASRYCQRQNVTFAPRTYGMTSKNGGVNKYPGGLTTSLGVHVVGNGVTFYNYGPAGAVTFALTGATLGGISLTAPTSEPYEGILFMQDAWEYVAGDDSGVSGMEYDAVGSFYFPKAKVV